MPLYWQWYSLSRRIKFGVWGEIRRINQIFPFIPPLTAISVCFLFAFNRQLGELYLSAIESNNAVHLVSSLGGVLLLSLAIFTSYYALTRLENRVFYSNQSERYIDPRLLELRLYAGAFFAWLPWLGLLIGLMAAMSTLLKHKVSLEHAISVLSPENPGELQHALESIRMLMDRMMVAAVVVLAVSLLAPVFTYRAIQKKGFRRRMFMLAGIVAAAVVVLPLGGSQGATTLSKLTGPLATVSLVLMSLVAQITLLAWFSRRIGIRLLLLVIVCIIAAGLLGVPMAYTTFAIAALAGTVAIIAFLSSQGALGLLSLLIVAVAISAGYRMLTEPGIQIDTRKPSVEEPLPVLHFETWLNTRRDRIAYLMADRRYPVFIIAAQGGGIYAADAAASFLARLQDRCPNFAQHIFAISSVSGGSIGSSVFQAMLVKQPQSAEPGCGDRSKPPAGFASRLPPILVADHLSPLLSALPPDLLGLPVDRSQSLVESFLHPAPCLPQVPGLFGDCSSVDDEITRNLSRPYAEHWSGTGTSPALLLNTTSVETGYRVVFSPFQLKGDDGTLYSFNDLLPGARRDERLIDAAVVSARFPGILPAYTFWWPERGQTMRRSFVDGGYADTSGAATAREVYDKLLEFAAKHGADVRIIVLTDSAISQNLNDINGTVAIDSLAPAVTLLNVRAVLTRQALKRATKSLTQYNSAAPGQDGNWQVAMVELDQQSFTLPLGWKISQATHDIIAIQMGQAEWCRKHSTAPNRSVSASGTETSIIWKNSCVVHAIQTLLSLKPAS